ncbi:MAG TPA: glycosyltransferase family 4 protein [Actinoplanes sp.]|nr:glycosyltransferase family 4 protein [Actinoplanes sp.]
MTYRRGALGHQGDPAGVHVVLPGNIDDPAAPSGGNRYDRAVCDGLARYRPVHEIAINGSWPRPAAAARRALARALGDISDESTVVMDGLVACGVPEVVEPEAGRLRFVVLVHLPLGDETGLSPAEAAELTASERRVLRAAAAVVVTSEGAARRVVELHGLPLERVHVARPGVDPARLADAGPGGGRLLCVAAVTPRKGQDVLVEALRSLEDLDWSCTCVGSVDRGVPQAPGRVRFTGPKTGADLDAAYAAADLLVLPSRAETYGMVVTEALARGIPVLGTQVNGVTEALGTAPDGARPGRLVPPGDAAALAGALREWLTDAELRRRWRAAARARRQALPGWDETVRRLIGVLDA